MERMESPHHHRETTTIDNDEEMVMTKNPRTCDCVCNEQAEIQYVIDQEDHEGIAHRPYRRDKLLSFNLLPGSHERRARHIPGPLSIPLIIFTWYVLNRNSRRCDLCHLTSYLIPQCLTFTF